MVLYNDVYSKSSFLFPLTNQTRVMNRNIRWKIRIIEVVYVGEFERCDLAVDDYCYRIKTAVTDVVYSTEQ